MVPEIKEMHAMHLVGCAEPINLAAGDFSGVQGAWERFFTLPANAIANVVECDRFWGVTNYTEGAQTYAAAKETSAADLSHTSHHVFEVPATKCAVFTHQGHPKDMGATFHAAYQWIENSQYEVAEAYSLELYDSRCNPDDMDNYIVDIFIPVK